MTILLVAVIAYLSYRLQNKWIAVSGVKIDISDTENSSKVEVLEQKIVVLEKALKSALENNDN